MRPSHRAVAEDKRHQGRGVDICSLGMGQSGTECEQSRDLKVSADPGLGHTCGHLVITFLSSWAVKSTLVEEVPVAPGWVGLGGLPSGWPSLLER